MNKRNNIFKLTYKTTISKLNKIIDSMDYNVILDKSKEIGNGESYDSFIEVNMRALIGINHLSERTRIIQSSNNQIVPDINFFKAIVCIFHESRHLELAMNHYKDVNKELLYSYISRQGNLAYYDINYFNFPTEIDAEYTGISKAYRYIKVNYPNINEHELYQLVYDYLYNRSDGKYYYFKNDEIIHQFKSINNLSVMFSNVYEQSLIKQRVIPINEEDNELSKTLHLPGFEELTYDLINQQKGMMQDKIISAVYFYNHPNDKQYFSTDDDLSLNTIIECNTSNELDIEQR